MNLLGRAGLISENGGKTTVLKSKDEDSADEDYYYYLESEQGCSGSGLSAAAKVRLMMNVVNQMYRYYVIHNGLII